jgi:phosphoglycerol transferase MdoB-like AlkP superfamily enzyme
MLKSFSFYLRYFLFWMIFFFLNRLFFEIWYASRISDSSFLDILKTFLYGAHMDASMAAYISAIPFLIFSISWLQPKFKFPSKIIKYYTFVLVFLTSLFTLIDINIYREWGTKFNYRAIEFFLTATGDAVASSSSSPVLASFSSIAILALIGFALYLKMISPINPPKTYKFYVKLPLIILALSFTFLALRGGWGVAPMNPSKVYFSDKQVLNYAAINTNWFLMSNVLSNQNTKGNPYTYFSESERKEIIDSLFKSNKDFPLIFKQQKPNVVLIIMESFTADLVEELGGEKGVTPNFSKLIKEGLLFDHIYSASDRTDKGLVGVISAFPSQAIRSIVKENDKQERLPSITQELTKNQYQSSFFYGGDTDFSNFKSYLLSHQYQKIIDVKSFLPEEVKTTWGAYDEVTFTKQIEFLNKEKQPFFSTLLTLSNHEPFDLPQIGKFGNSTTENKFRSTSFYTDQALWQYVENAKKQPWYANTIFIITADHGHRLPLSTHEIYNPARYHIPLLFFGGALKADFTGKRIDTYGNQVDIASTLLNQIGIIDTAFHYSKNLLSPSVKGFGFYSWDNGFGYIDKEKSVSYDPVGNKIIFTVPENLSEEQKEKALLNSKALMQSVFKDFLAY